MSDLQMGKFVLSTAVVSVYALAYATVLECKQVCELFLALLLVTFKCEFMSAS